MILSCLLADNLRLSIGTRGTLLHPCPTDDFRSWLCGQQAQRVIRWWVTVSPGLRSTRWSMGMDVAGRNSAVECR